MSGNPDADRVFTNYVNRLAELGIEIPVDDPEVRMVAIELLSERYAAEDLEPRDIADAVAEATEIVKGLREKRAE